MLSMEIRELSFRPDKKKQDISPWKKDTGGGFCFLECTWNFYLLTEFHRTIFFLFLPVILQTEPSSSLAAVQISTNNSIKKRERSLLSVVIFNFWSHICVHMFIEEFMFAVALEKDKSFTVPIFQAPSLWLSLLPNFLSAWKCLLTLRSIDGCPVTHLSRTWLLIHQMPYSPLENLFVHFSDDLPRVRQLNPSGVHWSFIISLLKGVFIYTFKLST